MAVDHDVDRFSNRLAHRADARLRVADGVESLERHSRGHGHRLEGGKTVGDALPRQLREALRVGGIAAVEIFHPPAAQVGVEPHEIAHRPAPELVARHAVNLPEDVPQRDVDPADRGAAHDPVAVPEMLAVHHLPQMLDARRVLPDQELADVLDRARDGAGVPLQRRLAPAPQPRLIGQDLHEDPVPHAGVTDESLDGGDLHANLT